MSGYHSLDVYIFRQSGDLYRDFYMSYTSPPGVLINYLIKLSSTLVNIEIDVLASNKHGTRNRLQFDHNDVLSVIWDHSKTNSAKNAAFASFSLSRNEWELKPRRPKGRSRLEKRLGS